MVGSRAAAHLDRGRPDWTVMDALGKAWKPCTDVRVLAAPDRFDDRSCAQCAPRPPVLYQVEFVTKVGEEEGGCPPARPWQGRYTVTKGSDLRIRSNDKIV